MMHTAGKLTVLLAFVVSQVTEVNADLADGLQLHIQFENNVVDSSPNKFDGQASGNLQYTSGVIGQAAIFDGTDDQVLFPTFSDDLISNNNFTIAFWFRIPDGPLISVMGKRENCGLEPFFDIRTGNSRVMGFELSNSDNFLSVFSPATSEKWHHFAFTRAGTDLQVFLDGEPVKQGTSPGIFDISNSATLALSNSPCIGVDGTKMMSGSLDDLRIYDRLLSNVEIYSLVNIFADSFESEAIATQ